MSVTSDFPSRLMRFEVDSSERTIRPLRFSFARSSSPLREPAGRDLADLLDADLDAAARFSSRVPTYTPRMPVSVYCAPKL